MLPQRTSIEIALSRKNHCKIYQQTIIKKKLKKTTAPWKQPAAVCVLGRTHATAEAKAAKEAVPWQMEPNDMFVFARLMQSSKTMKR